MKNFSKDKTLIGGMAADVTREHKNRLQPMKIKYIQLASPYILGDLSSLLAKIVGDFYNKGMGSLEK